MSYNGEPSAIVPALTFDVLGSRSLVEGLAPPADAIPGALPVADVTPRTDGDAIWLSTVIMDSDGRISVRAAARHLGWTTGRVTVVADPPAGALVVTAGGPQAITAKGLLRLPLATRRACDLAVSTQLLLVVPPDCAALLAFAPYAVQRWIRYGYEQRETGQ
ncbi:hypothetical protein [Hamadaea tsunoensis]|uniref:hypothetical protein n=1 Tax=Hamadaea tsunoensis TaxID=53368 RepID=UPI00047F3A93|nr:hypothetical protein [Hamadaea tsunoensis]